MAEKGAKKKQPESTHWVGFDLGGTKMLAVVYDSKFEPLNRSKKKTKGYEGEKAGVDKLGDLIEEALADAEVSADSLAGIGLGVPGPLDLKKGILLDAPNLGWSNVPLRKLLKDRFGVPVTLCNDVDAGTYGEYRFGAGRKADTVVGIFPGTGIGGGCVLRGDLVEGETQSCMEIGHITVVPDGPLCGCGKRGCLEAVASRLAIASAAAVAAYRGEAPNLLDEAGTDLRQIRSGTLARAVEAGDKSVEKIIRQAARWVGLAAGTVVNLLAADRIILGGGLVEAMPDLFVDEVSKGLKAHAMPALGKDARVVVAELGDDAAVLGAAAWAEASQQKKRQDD